MVFCNSNQSIKLQLADWNILIEKKQKLHRKHLSCYRFSSSAHHGNKVRQTGGQTDRWSDRQVVSQTDRWSDRQTGGQTDRWSVRQVVRQTGGQTDRWSVR